MSFARILAIWNQKSSPVCCWISKIYVTVNGAENAGTLNIFVLESPPELLRMALGPLTIETEPVEEEPLLKVFNDPIHGSIELPAICVAIIDTPEFQRLRHIKQLGLTCLVYPTAVHTRFDHSIGVCHLADEMVQALRKRHGPKDSRPIDITEEEHLCVMIAGLCRDLGFGPFSHLFDQRFMRNKEKDYTENNLEKEIKFIQELIDPPPGLWEKDSTRTAYKTRWFCEGRGEDKSYLYLIVKNTLNGIDVAKWDYCARDCHFLGIPNSFDHQRLLKFSRVLEWGGRSEICFKFKEAFNLYNLYRMRHVLHMRAYQHSAKNAAEIMFSEALEEVDKSLTIARKDTGLNMLFGEGNLSGRVDNVHDFLSLTDDIYRRILLCPPHPDIDSARAILQKIDERQLYKLVVEATYSAKVKEDEISLSAWKALGIQNLDSHERLAFIETVYFDYGVNREEPLRNVHFFTKCEPNVPFFLRKEQEPRVLPENMLERKIRVYCKSTETSCRDNIHEGLMQWWTEQYQSGAILSTPPNVICPSTPASSQKTSPDFKANVHKREPHLEENRAKRHLSRDLEDLPSTSQQSRRSERIAKKMRTEEQHSEPTKDTTTIQEEALKKSFHVVVENARDNWKEIGRRLQFTETDINSIDQKERGDCTECMRTVLHRWTAREGKRATIFRLMEALKAARNVDVMEKVSDIANELELKE
ncbi:deoxynucleoside triphosphate triphosphohydrolase SAMHD1-like isoform X2 [Branchiostoma floridae]|uniref:Deoxynucleoside triphosphate triphosphohydrolase SAMHD1-like isoform X2 n=1 Tax=Branchiostoma floridae TaxID=7739 RepID=A0A9J7HJ37_BRAFL|nr:deoxynucleoside triphosphate triphosphohydrolase SAMHD1-like isoform X2 [Branchiostoma floridae]